MDLLAAGLKQLNVAPSASCVGKIGTSKTIEVYRSITTHLILRLGLAELLHLAQTACLLCGSTPYALLFVQALALHLICKTLQTLAWAG
jgi:hypothetical protein